MDASVGTRVDTSVDSSEDTREDTREVTCVDTCVDVSVDTYTDARVGKGIEISILDLNMSRIVAPQNLDMGHRRSKERIKQTVPDGIQTHYF